MAWRLWNRQMTLTASDRVMLRDIEPLQGKSWHERMFMLVDTAGRIAKEHQSPLKNDAKGILDCYRLEDKLGDCIQILKTYKEAKR